MKSITNKKTRIFTGVLLLIFMTLAIIPLHSFATSKVQIDNKTHNYEELSSLPYEYSYGTLFWTSNTSVEPVQYNSKYFKENYTHSVTYGACVGETLKLKINSCSVDKDGDLCDVLITVKDVKAFSKYTVNNKFGPDFGESTNDPANCRIEIAITQLDSNFGDLIYFWFNTNAASASFNMEYVKAETNEPANIPYNVSTFFDFDVPSIKNKGLEGEYYEGNEGISVPSSTIYYDKSSSTGYLIDAKQLPSGYDIGVCTPSYSTIPVLSNDPEKQTSCVAIQELKNSTFKMHYSGRSCGVAWVFISPYSYETANPDIAVDAEQVYEGQTFNYTISQYVPNNYYAETLQFIEGVGGHYSNFAIKNQLSDKLTINGNIVVRNEAGRDVTSYFNISTDNNCVLAELKPVYLSDKNFYSHIYSVSVPVYINLGTGLSQSYVSNSAETIFENSLESKELETSEVNVLLKYDVNVISSIDHGTTYINDNSSSPSSSASVTNTVSHGDNNSNTVYFEVADEYNLKSVTVDNEIIENEEINEENGVYSYTFTDNNITENISHTVNVVTEVKDAKVTATYKDESGKELSDTEIINGKVFDSYNTENKTIYGYELISVPDNVSGTMTVSPITVNYVYRLKDASVIVNYVDDSGNKLCESETINGKVFDKYTTDEKSFYGYRLTATPVNATGTMTEDNIEVNYIYTKKQASVTANYITEDNKVISDPVITTSNVGDNYNTSSKNIYGYELIGNPSNATGTYTEEDIIVNYVYRVKSTHITVNYITDTGETLTDAITINGKVFETYNTENKQFTGYELTALPDNATGEMTEEPITVTYIYRLKDTSVLVNYITNDGTSLTEPVLIKGKVFDNYNSEAKSFYGYELTATPDNASGTMTETQIIVNYIYQLKNSSVTACYVNEDGDKIEKDVVITGDVTDEYETVAKSIYGYELIETPANATGEFTEEPITVTYIYRLKNTSVTVKYVTTEGNALCSPVIIEGKVFDKYETQSKDFYGYSLSNTPENATGEMTEETIEVTYIYSLDNASVIVNYIDENNNKLADSITLNGKVFDEYSTESKTVYGYELTATPQNANGEMTEEQIVVNYIYRLKDASVIVNYVTDNGEKLTDSITLSGKVFDEYNTENKTFYGYSLISIPENATGTMTEDQIVVDYVYKLKETSVLVNYIDEDGNELEDSVLIEGNVFDEYETENKSIYGYTLKEKPANASGEMTEDQIIVNYVYTLNDAVVYVDYVTDSGQKLQDTISIEGKVFDKYLTEEKTFYGYNLTSTTNNLNGTMTDVPINVVYTYTLKDTSVLVNYVSDTGKTLTESKTINGKVFDEYETEKLDFYGYSLTKLPENATGEMTENVITVNYIYTLKPSNVIVNYINEDGEKLSDSITLNGKVFDEYTTESKTIYGYELTATPQNAAGEMTEEQIIVNYVYRLKDATVLVNYFDENNNSLTDSITIEGKVFDEYQTENKSFYGYSLIKVPDNAEGTMTEDQITVNYIYKLKDASVLVNYLNENGETLADSVTINGKVFEEYQTENKTFYGYELTAVPENATGNMAEEQIVVDYIYQLKPATVIAHYIDEDGNAIAEDSLIEGKVFDDYETQSKEIYGYVLTEIPENATGKMAEENIDVNYVYILREAVVNVNYITKDGTVIADAETINGKVFDKYKTEDKKIDGYKLTATPDNATGEMTEEPITVNYIYEKIPEPEVPYTGDNTHYEVFALIGLVLIVAGTSACIYKKKNKYSSK